MPRSDSQINAIQEAAYAHLQYIQAYKVYQDASAAKARAEGNLNTKNALRPGESRAVETSGGEYVVVSRTSPKDFAFLVCQDNKDRD